MHITPSSSLTSYFQEMGRAGRHGGKAEAILFFTNADIAANRTSVSQARCCNHCHPHLEVGMKTPAKVKPCRQPLHPDDEEAFNDELCELMQQFNLANEDSLFDSPVMDSNTVQRLMDHVEFVDSKEGSRKRVGV